MAEIPKIPVSGCNLEDFVINTLCQPDKVLVGLDYNPYEKVWVAKYIKRTTAPALQV